MESRDIRANQSFANMNKETLDFFLTGLRVAIKRMGIPQQEFAKGVTTKENLSKILNRQVGTSPEMRQALSERAGMDVAEIVLLGQQQNEHVQPAKIHAAMAEDPLDMLDAVAKAYRVERDEKRYWKSCFDSLVIPVCIIDQTGHVIYQNQADRSLYKADMVGEEMCPACRGNDSIPHLCDDCAVERAMSIGESTEKDIIIHGNAYHLIASPTNTSEGRHVIVLAIPAHEHEQLRQERSAIFAQMEALLNTAEIPLAFGDRDQNLAYVSAEFFKLFGIKRGQISTSVDFWALLVEKLVDPAEAIKICKAARNQKLTGECAIAFHSGDKYTLVAQPATDADNNLMGVMVRFIKSV